MNTYQTILDLVVSHVQKRFPDISIDSCKYDRLVSKKDEIGIVWKGPGTRNFFIKTHKDDTWIRFCHQGQICTDNDYDKDFLNKIREMFNEVLEQTDDKEFYLIPENPPDYEEDSDDNDNDDDSIVSGRLSDSEAESNRHQNEFMKSLGFSTYNPGTGKYSKYKLSQYSIHKKFEGIGQ